MSDNINEFLDNAFAAEEGGAAAAPEPVAPAEASPVDLDGDLEGDKFDRAYVERLRKEAASYRSKAKTFEDAFDGYSDEDRQGLFYLAKQLREDPRAAAQEMAQAAEAILKQYQESEPAEAPEFDPSEDYMTRSEFERIREEEAVNNEVKNIEVEARSLGYNPVPGDLDYRMLLLTAQNSTKSGSLKEAHDIIQARQQKVIDEYLAAKAADAQGPHAPSESAQIPGTAEPIKTFKDARGALEAYIASQRGGM